MNKIIAFFLFAAACGPATSARGATNDLTLAPPEPAPKDAQTLDSPPAGIWQEKVGQGFRAGVQTLSLEVGGVYGVAAFGSMQSHHMGLGSISYGYMLSGVKGEGHWYRGNFEFRAELFGGAQYYPSPDWLIGLTPHLRYNFATGTRWVPFFDVGAGVSATEIGPPDLSDCFEFNLQANIGTHWFISRNFALTVEAGFLHLSCAGIHQPNQGVNGVKGLFGVTWFL